MPPAEERPDSCPSSPDSPASIDLEDRPEPPQVFYEDPASLHLRPVTDEDLEHIVFPPDERFEVVDGLLVWDRMAAGTSKHQRLPELHAKFFDLDAEYKTAQGKVQAIKADIKDEQEGKRMIDLALRSSTASPTSSLGTLSPSPQRRRKETFAYHSSRHPADHAIEYTSSNFKTDFYIKWKEFRRTHIDLVILFDLYHRTHSGNSRAIVGSIDHIQNSHLSDNGDPNPTPRSSSAPARPSQMYYKRVFTDNEVFSVGAFAKHGFTVKQWMSESFMSAKIEQRRSLNAQLHQKLTNFKAELKKEKKAHEEARKALAESRKETAESRKETAEARKETAKARKEASRWKQELENLKNLVAQSKFDAGSSSRDRKAESPQGRSSSKSSPVKSPEKKKHRN